MKTLIPRPPPWNIQNSFGALFVVATLVFFAVTFWLGWPAVNGWLWSH